MKNIIFVILLLIVGCKDKSTDSTTINAIEAGKYNGVFTFTENGETAIGNVEFTFTDTSYKCVPVKKYLPPVGEGKYEIQKDKIILTDMMIHTAEFDWTLILGGEFDFIKNGNTVVLVQEDKERNRFRKIELSKSN